MAKKKMMLIDTSKCTACRACQIACQQWHQLPAEGTSFTGSYQNPPDVSSANLTVVKFFEVVNDEGKLKWLFFGDRCRHCKIPLCMENCPLGAINQTAKGFVYISGKCKPWKCSPNSVKPCQLACPFKSGPVGIPRYTMNNGEILGKGKANKCDFCYDRWKAKIGGDPNPLKEAPFNGEFAKSAKPACELVCPTGAISTGTPRAKRREAEEKVLELKANGYPKANVYPQSYETQVIWVLLDDPFVAYGLDPL